MSNDCRLSGRVSMIFCSLGVAVLAACGGGGGGGSAVAVADTADGTAAIAVAAVAGSDAASAGDSSVATPVADASSSADATADATALGLRTPPVLAVPIALEGQNFRLLGTMTVRYGAGNAWVSKSVTDSGSCTAAAFGSDPARGTAKTCQVVLAANTTTASVTETGLPASEGGTFYVYGTRSVQYGANGRFLKKDVTGRGECSVAFFGNDPAIGVLKTCTFTPAGSPAVTSLMPAVDPSKIPAAVTGYNTARVKAANTSDPGQIPVASDIGDFREYCEFSHMSYADPIAAPGSVSAHLHTFLGNTGTNANSTASSIASSGNSTCAGGTLNRTAYWVPTVIDTTDGTPQAPLGSLIYYKQGYNYIPSAAIHPFPAGLRIVAGNPASMGVQDNTGFTCTHTDGSFTTSKTIPTDCPAGAVLNIGVAFPQCWDGVNLDSPDHKSHMAYPGIGCPATHPVALTGITFSINYRVGPNGTSRWRLSSDNYDSALPGGYSTHADWFNGWSNDILSVWTTRCINATMDCHAFLIGDGRILY